MAAEAILSGLIPVILDKLISPAIMGAFGTGNNRKKLQKLKRIMERIQSVIIDAEERQSVDTSIKSWLSALKDAVYEAEDLLEDFDFEARWNQRLPLHKKVLSYRSLSNPITTRFNLSRRLSDIIGKIDAIADEYHKFNFQLHKGPKISYVWPQTHSCINRKDVVGREEEKENIVRFLINHDGNKNIAVLPIVAMGGMGKTTLCKLVYGDQRVAGHFQLLMWVSVSDDFDIAHLLKKIIESATNNSCQVSNVEVLQRNIREIIREKRYLIVLDDVWNEDEYLWENLKLLLDCGGEGSAVLVTTRSWAASKIMSMHINTIHHLKELPAEDSWELFRRRAFMDGAEEHAALIDIGKKIVRRCGGLPLAIKTIGSLMRFKNHEREWTDVLESEMLRVQAVQDNILPALRLSYTHLSPHSKQCFAFCALYPKNYVMERETLVQLWMANGYIPIDEAIDLETKGEEIYNELVCRSFFENVEEVGHDLFYNIKFFPVECKMHDLMHDLAQSVMGKECINMQKIEQWEDIPTNVRHLLVPSFPRSVRPDIHVPATIRTLVEQYDEWYTFETHCDTSKCMYLRVLGCTSVNFSKQFDIKRQLRHLRWLDLSHTNIKELPEDICSLHSLQTLHLSYCYGLERLPAKLIMLENLRHLYIDWCYRLVCMPEKMGQMKQLRTLTMYIVSHQAEGGIEQLRDLNICGRLDLRGLENVTNAVKAKDANLFSKQKLDDLLLSWGKAGSLEVFEALKPHNGLRRLIVEEYACQQFPIWMNTPLQIQNLVEINLRRCKTCKDLPAIGLIPFLKFLTLSHFDELKYVISKSAYCNMLQSALFPSLKMLQLSSMKVLEDWLEAEGIKVQGLLDKKLLFPCLIRLHISDCMKLKYIPDIPSLQSLSLFSTSSNVIELKSKTTNASCVAPLKSLKHLNVTGYEEMRLCPENEEETESLSSPPQYIELLDCFWMFSKLERLSLMNCNGIKCMPGLNNLTSLQHLSISNCDDLESLSEGMEDLTQLRRLGISGCNKLMSLPEGLRRRLPSLIHLVIAGHDELVRPFRFGGDLWHLVSNIWHLAIEVYPNE